MHSNMRFAPSVTVSGAIRSVMLGPGEIGDLGGGIGVGRRVGESGREWGRVGESGSGREEEWRYRGGYKELHFYMARSSGLLVLMD